MIYRAAYISDCARHMGVIFPITLSVGGLIFLSRLLSETAANALPPASLWQFLALAMIKYMPQLLVVSLFAGILLAVERAFERREMTAWFAAGIGLRHFIAPGVMFAVPIVIAVAGLSCVLSPWAVRAADTLRAQLTHDINPQYLRVGEFGITPGGIYTYFLGGDEEQTSNVFIARNGGDAHEIISSRAVSRSGDELMTLEHGALFRLPRAAAATADSEPPEIITFERMKIHLPMPKNQRNRPRGAYFGDLKWQSAAARAELIWRINQPLAALFFALLAPLIGGSFARGGQRHGFLIAVLLFIAHLNLLYFVRDQMAADQLHFLPAILLAPAVATAAALLLRRTPTK